MSVAPPTIAMRRLSIAHLDAIEVIERRAYRTPWSRTMFEGELIKPSSLCLGAFREDELVGYLILSRYVDAWHVMNVAVAPEQQGQGIASALIERVIDLTDGDGKRGYTLEVRISNERAIRLYERMGFRSHGIRRGYYTDNREDAIIMWRESEPDSPRA